MTSKSIETIKGLYYYPDFLTTDEEREIIKYLEESTLWENPVMGFGPLKRKVIQYGYSYPYTRRGKLEATTPIPTELDLTDKFNVKSLESFRPEQLIVNCYLSKERIAPHVDHTELFGETIACVTLNRAATMVFSRGSQKIEVPVARRSIYVMTGDARYEWKHSMKPETNIRPRYSLTYRTKRLVARLNIGGQS